MEYTHYAADTKNLVGIANIPNRPLQGKPAVIFVNGGFLHRVGPYRLYTTLSRLFEKAGFHVFRFDLSGLGDSSSKPKQGTEQQHQADVRTAIEFMCSHYGCSSVILCGLCSGADDSLTLATSEPRVSGLLFLDPPGFRTPRFIVNRLLRHHRSRLFSVKKWARLCQNLTGAVLDKSTAAPGKSPTETVLDDEYRPLMDAENLIPTVKQLIDQDVRMHFIYTGGVFHYYNYAGQVFDMFSSLDLKENLSESFHPDADHMLLLENHRQAVIDDMLNWLTNNFDSEQRTLNKDVHSSITQNDLPNLA